MDERKGERDETILLPCFRVRLCGAFRVEHRVGSAYEVIRTAEWGGSSYPRLLLKALLNCPGRQARREALIEMLWPDTDPEQAAHYLNTATTKLRKVLEPIKGQESLLLTEDDALVYRLEGQHLLWMDADEGVTLLKQAEQRGRTAAETLPLLEKAGALFNTGTFLQEEEGFWAAGRRATIERARYRCRLWLAEAYEQQGMPGQAEMVISTLLEEDPIDEDVLSRLMALLHRQGMTQKALRLYEQTCETLTREGMEPTEAITLLAKRFQEQRYHHALDPLMTDEASASLPGSTFPFSPASGERFPAPLLSPSTSHSSFSSSIESCQVRPTRREVLELVGTSAVSLAAPEIFGTETRHEFTRVLNKPSVLEKHHLSLLEERTRLLWKYREDEILSPHELYTTVDRHLQQIVRLLDGSLLPSIRTQLLAVASKTVTLNGALFYDLGMHEQAKKHYRLAIQAAAQAEQPILQAVAYAWMSFSSTYERRYLEASHSIALAISLLTDLDEDRKTFAWLTAVAAEVCANLGNYDECSSFLEQAEASLEAPLDHQHVYLHQFSTAQFRGFRGVCYQVLYHPKKPETHALLEQARIALEQALNDASASTRGKQLYLANLASVYARQGEVEMACTLTKQTVDTIDQTTPKNVVQRLTEIQQLLQPWNETTYVKELNGFFRMVGII